MTETTRPAKIIYWRPVGGVACPECGRNQNSGGFWFVRFSDGSTGKFLACDRCKGHVRARIMPD